MGKSGLELLKRFAKTLCLEEIADTTLEDYQKQVEDEVMLTGTESFLKKLSKATIVAQSKALGLKTSHPQEELVEK